MHRFIALYISAPLLVLVLQIATYADSAEGKKAFEEGVRVYQSGGAAKAIQLFQRAFELGDLRGATQIGFQYETGDGVGKDYAKAAQWYRKAAEAGESRAMKNLGKFYEDGTGVPEDWVTAVQWYKRSAQKGDVDGLDAMGAAYQYGIGVPQDRETARQWYKRAADKGNRQSAASLRWLSSATNFVGFRNAVEQNMVIGGQLRTSAELLGADPAGLLFHNSRERNSWLQKLRGQVDCDEAQQRRRRELESQERHVNEVNKLMRQGYTRSEADRRAGW